MIWPQLSSVLPGSLLPAFVVPSTKAAVASTASTVRAVAQGLTAVPAALPVVGPMLRPGRPKVWRTSGGVQIEVRRLGRPGTASAARELEAALRRVPGVSRAEVNGTLGCAYVGCGPETDVAALVDMVGAADTAAEEEALGARRSGGADQGRPPVGYPGAAGARIGSAVRLGAGLVAVGVASVGNAVGLRGLPPAVISALQLVESMPPLREGLARRIGEPAAERGFAAANMLVTTLTFRPLGAVVAAVLAAARYGEVQARRTAWGNWSRRLAVHEGTYRHDAVPGYERPAPLPPGPGERYANVAAPASLAAYGLTTLGRLGQDRGLALLIAGTPRGPRFGREAFASSVGRAVSDRGALVLRPETLRRLDRVDMVVLDARVLADGAWTVESVLRLPPTGPAEPGLLDAGGPADGGGPDAALPVASAPVPESRGPQTGGPAPVREAGDPDGERPGDDEIHARLHELIAPDGPPPRWRIRHGGVPLPARRLGSWELRPFTGAAAVPGDDVVPDETAARARRWAEEGAQVMLVLREGTPVAMAALVPQLHPLAHHLVRAARECGEVRLVGGPPGLHRRFGLAQAAPTGHRRTAALVRSLQADGHGVAVISARTRRALVRADLGIGVITVTRHVPWDADVAAPPDVVHLLLAALPEARRISRLCTRLEVVGAALGSGLALLVPRPRAWVRARLVTDGVTIAGIAAGFWAGWQLHGRPAPAAAERTPWHAMTVRQVMARLGTSSRGLDEAEAARRRQFEGHDRHDGAVTLIGRVAEELANPLTPVLAIGGGISAALGSVLDAVLIGGVLGVDALVGGVQRQQADEAAERLVEATSARVRVRRPDRAEAVEAAGEHLVRGDVIELRAGDAVPADCRVVRAQGLEVDESSLTGESLPVVKSAAPTAARTVADRTSMLYQGTTVAAGHALAVVVATGTATEAGSAAEAVPESGPPESGVERRLKALGRWFLPLSIAAGVVLFAVELLRRRPAGAALGSAVSLCVAAVPEGLPFVATVAELAAARRLSTRDTLVRSASTIEALGRTDVLCFDKTGTLTEGRISLQQVSDALDRRPPDRLTPPLRRIVATAALAGPRGPAATLAHPTDRAIAAGAELLDDAPERAAGLGSDTWEQLAELPFEPGRGFHAVVGRTDSEARMVVKGAPEVVLARCDRIRRGAATEAFGDRLREQIEAEIDRLARRGLRVLAVAEHVPPTGGPQEGAELADEDVDGLCLLGLLGLADPVRATAAESVDRLSRAGVRIVMLTGDHPSTAAAIARELRPEEEPRLMTGAELDALDDDALARTLPDITVFARVTPAHKVRIVTALRSAGRIVAVTGDGANDAPAIRIADVGIALGSRATPAARAAADVVVTDDRIETIVDAFVEGRAMWASVRKALGILLGGNLGEIVFTLATTLFTGRSALNARQLLLVNVLTDMLPAMAIAARPPADHAGRLLAEGPEASLGTALTRHIRLRAVLTTAAATVAWVLARATGTRGHADTVALVALVTSQLLQTLVDAGRDPVVAAAVAGSLVVLGVVVSVPGLSHFFGSRPLGPAGWTIALASAAGSVLVPAAAQGIAGMQGRFHPKDTVVQPRG
ncbi:cation-translocating P-type ATPase [Streptomyces spinoverrucosus]|uniref:cation-translocating P-type ATPase n=1 Tax=Streptomyces spinoverrucosus TaxID=284043 RepID=UPI0018C3E302|nr:cation-translocating P-type ATPase [Streptomyces spinoverrucosus]MBG0855926.1 cation-translocating P-type ATPase [Streptomyces spinoverrucosus]